MLRVPTIKEMGKRLSGVMEVKWRVSGNLESGHCEDGSRKWKDLEENRQMVLRNSISRWMPS